MMVPLDIGARLHDVALLPVVQGGAAVFLGTAVFCLCLAALYLFLEALLP